MACMCVTTVSPEPHSSTPVERQRAATRSGLFRRRAHRRWTRGRAFPCQARMRPRFAARRDTKSPLSRHPVPATATGNRCFMPSHCHTLLDLQALLVIHYRLPRAILGPLHRGAKGVAVVTCPSSPGPEPGWPSRPRRPPRGFCFVVHVPSTFASPELGAL